MPTCPEGHDNPVGGRYCSTCAAPLPRYPQPPDIDRSDPLTPGFLAPPPPAMLGNSGSRPRPRTFLVAALVAVVVVAGGFALSRSGDRTPAHTIRGTLSLFDLESVDGSITDCSGSGGYSDIDAGMNVTVRNAKDEIVGSGRTEHMTKDELVDFLLETDQADDEAEARETIDTIDGFACILSFEIEVSDEEFYEVALGDGDRGKMSESRRELEEGGWRVDYNLGDVGGD